MSLRAQKEKEKVLRFMTTTRVNECVCVFVRESERGWGGRGGGRGGKKDSRINRRNLIHFQTISVAILFNNFLQAVT